MSRTRMNIWILAVGLCALGAAGCGDDTGGGGDTGPRTDTGTTGDTGTTRDTGTTGDTSTTGDTGTAQGCSETQIATYKMKEADGQMISMESRSCAGQALSAPEAMRDQAYVDCMNMAEPTLVGTCIGCIAARVKCTQEAECTVPCLGSDVAACVMCQCMGNCIQDFADCAGFDATATDADPNGACM